MSAPEWVAELDRLLGLENIEAQATHAAAMYLDEVWETGDLDLMRPAFAAHREAAAAYEAAVERTVAHCNGQDL